MKFPEWLPVYGDVSFRGVCSTEAHEQESFFRLLRLQYPRLAAAAVHPKNETKVMSGAHFNHICKAKKMGQLKGASDILIMGAPSLVCELKRRDHTKSQWQSGQIEFLQASLSLGAFVCVALGADAAIEAVKNWEGSRQ